MTIERALLAGPATFVLATFLLLLAGLLSRLL